MVHGNWVNDMHTNTANIALKLAYINLNITLDWRLE